MVKRFGFEKKEKLKSRKQIEDLFASGKGFFIFPIRVSYRFMPGEEGLLQVGVSASKRNFKRAVDRNRIKRMLREAYRLQKMELTESAKQLKLNGSIFFICTDKTIPSFEMLKISMRKCLERLQKSLINENRS